jgi:K+-transporting ATPase ATPase C chain
MFKELRPAIVLFASITVVTGILYPLVVTVVAQTAFPVQSQGSVIEVDGKAVGSELIGQSFDDPKYFWGRLSATSPVPYVAFNADAGSCGSGSNLGPTNSALIDASKARIDALRAADPGNDRPVPIDLVTASGSGLDPHISPAAAEFQAARVARVRGLSLEAVRKIVAQNTQGRAFGLLGEPAVHVLRVNLALDAMSK